MIVVWEWVEKEDVAEELSVWAASIFLSRYFLEGTPF